MSNDEEPNMSGHSKWSTIKRAKGAKDAARGAVFTRLGNAIAVAARAGADPDMNFSLRLAIDKAKAANMPLANIQRSVDRGSGKLGGDQIQEVLYEGYGPGGVAILVECATDNLNRTYPEVKLAFSKHGGNIAEKGAVAFQFDHKGMIRVKGGGDELMLQVLDAGAEDIESDDQDGSVESIVYTDMKDLAKVRDALKDADVEIMEAELTYVPNNTVEVTDQATAGKIMRIMDALESIDDVSNTHVNFDIDESLL
ncbi:MAG: YebC/PmpR family DNA-binding transcriptional regulator [Candidatus Saccharibacteria bacterium]|nr:YebC/PmpR family DNA-binding transcriptional regulator [Candidatus Saccharibacteria bacterium]